jgi:hypothetical protein
VIPAFTLCFSHFMPCYLLVPHLLHPSPSYPLMQGVALAGSSSYSGTKINTNSAALGQIDLNGLVIRRGDVGEGHDLIVDGSSLSLCTILGRQKNLRWIAASARPQPTQCRYPPSFKFSSANEALSDALGFLLPLSQTQTLSAGTIASSPDNCPGHDGKGLR